MKTCSKCNQHLPKEFFGKKKSAKDGLQSSCRICISKYNKLYYTQNETKVKEKVYEYKETHKQQISTSMKQYYEINKEGKLQKAKEYRKTDNFKIACRNAHAKRKEQTKSSGVTTEELNHIITNNPNCFWCNTELAGSYHIDHFYPLSKGGLHEMSNLVVSCPTCNLQKNAKDPFMFADEIGKKYI